MASYEVQTVTKIARLEPRLSIHLAAPGTQAFRSRFCLAVLEKLQKLQDKTTRNRHRWGPQNIPYIFPINNSKTTNTNHRGLWFTPEVYSWAITLS